MARARRGLAHIGFEGFGVLWVEGFGFWFLRYAFQGKGLGFRGLDCRGLGFAVWGIGFAI